MSKYIDAEKLIAEIKGLQCEQGFEDGMEERGYQFAIEDILDIIDLLQQGQQNILVLNKKDWEKQEQFRKDKKFGIPLQQEQPEVDLKKEIQNYFHGYWPGMETAEQCNTDMHFTPPAIMRLAEYFYELGGRLCSQ